MKYDQILLLDECYASEAVGNKGETYEKDPRSRGCSFKNTARWRLHERDTIRRAAAQEHTKQLLCIDKDSRKKGRFVGMEKILFGLFRARRARGRKTSSKWLVHTARFVMRTEFAEDAPRFAGGRGWLQRFKKRWSICTRKKTNCKNTTWAETKPVLQAYFRAFRRRLRDDQWREARAAAFTATHDPCRRLAAAVAANAVAAVVLAAAHAAVVSGAEEELGWAGLARARTQWDAVDASPAAAGVPTATSPATAAATPATASTATSPATAAATPATASTATSPAMTGRYEETGEAWWKRGRDKYGKYLLWQRFNTDQVPMPFVCDMDYTLDIKGAKRVSINQLGPSLSKRQCTAQVSLRAAPPPSPPDDAPTEVKDRCVRFHTCPTASGPHHHRHFREVCPLPRLPPLGSTRRIPMSCRSTLRPS